MKLDVRDAADLLRVSTKTIYRWVAAGKLPGYRVSRELRFDRAELLEWATANRLEVDPAPLADTGEAVPVPRFDEALLAGGIHYRVEGDSRDEVLANVVRSIPISHEADREPLRDAIRAREDLASTAVGDGIAIPHLRNPLRLHLDRASIALCLLEHPVDWGAPDGAPVTALFVLTGPTVRTVLGLQSQTWFALRDKAFRRAVLEQRARESIFAAARRVAGTFVRGEVA